MAPSVVDIEIDPAGTVRAVLRSDEHLIEIVADLETGT
jgi:hypothetical protein